MSVGGSSSASQTTTGWTNTSTGSSHIFPSNSYQPSAGWANAPIGTSLTFPGTAVGGWGSQFPASPPVPASLPPLNTIQEPPFTLSALGLLEILPPPIQSRSTGIARASSASNLAYANIGVIDPLEVPNDLCGYSSLSSSLSYHPTQADPTADLEYEADAVMASYTYIVRPVNMVLFANSFGYSIRTRCEDTHCVKVRNASGEEIELVSRVDYSWQAWINNGWETFFVLEYKRPGAIKAFEFAQAFAGTDTVKGSGEKICRQLVKYGYTRRVTYCCAFDWDTMLLLRFKGDRQLWYSDRYAVISSIRVDGSLISDKSKMKRELYIHVRRALRYELQSRGLLTTYGQIQM